MNFDFSEDIKTMREEVRRYLADRVPAGAVRKRIESGHAFDRDLWREMAEMGWLGVAIPENYGGAELGHEALCMIAEEIGMALPPVPFAASIYGAAEALLVFGSEEQKQKYLPQLASGKIIGTFAIAEGPGDPAAATIYAKVQGGKLSGAKLPVMDGDIADIAIVAAVANGKPGLYLVELNADSVSREPMKTLDIAHGYSRLTFKDAAADPLPGAGDWDAVATWLDRIAILCAFEQVGGAQAALNMAVEYAKDHYAFGRPIGSFQALKHKLADMYVATELARSNAYYGAWALESGTSELSLAASAARVAATDAFHLASKENIQTHGGMGFTWESDCHLYYRRAKQLATLAGSSRYWRNRLIDHLRQRNDA